MIDTLAEHLTERAGSWFPELCGREVGVARTGSQNLTFSSLDRFELWAGQWRAHVLAKVRRDPLASAGTPASWECLVPLPRCEERSSFEFAALTRIHQQFSAMGDPRFGSVRPLELLPDAHTLLMEDLRQPTLDQAIRRAAPALRRRATTNAGAWLRSFHDSTEPSSAPLHLTTRESFIESVHVRTDSLAQMEGQEPFFHAVADRVAKLASEGLPEEFPPVVAHSDYWPGNVLVAPDGRVAAIDTLSAWRGAIFYDLAYFGISLKASNRSSYAQGLSRRARQQARLEADFLAGYFGEEPIPWSSVRLFELQLLLHNWRRASCSAAEASRESKASRRLRLLLKRPFYRRLAGRLLRDAEDAA